MILFRIFPKTPKLFLYYWNDGFLNDVYIWNQRSHTMPDPVSEIREVRVLCGFEITTAHSKSLCESERCRCE